MSVSSQVTKPTDSEITDLLHDLVVEQREELEEQSLLTSLDSGKSILSWFEESDSFRQIYEQAMEYHLMPHTDEKLGQFRRRFAGRLYEDLAFSFLTSIEYPSRIVLSPKRTLAFYQRLYLDSDVIEEGFGLDSLEGIFVPDGLVVEEQGSVERIVAVSEYTVRGDEGYFKRKLRGFSSESEEYPQLFDDAYLLFVVPDQAALIRNAPKSGNFKFRTIPFTHEQFRDFIDSIYERYQQDMSRIPNT